LNATVNAQSTMYPGRDTKLVLATKIA